MNGHMHSLNVQQVGRCCLQGEALACGIQGRQRRETCLPMPYAFENVETIHKLPLKKNRSFKKMHHVYLGSVGRDGAGPTALVLQT